MKFTTFTRKGGVRRIVKHYGQLRDKVMEARERRYNGKPIRLPYAAKGVQTSVRKLLR